MDVRIMIDINHTRDVSRWQISKDDTNQYANNLHCTNGSVDSKWVLLTSTLVTTVKFTPMIFATCRRRGTIWFRRPYKLLDCPASATNRPGQCWFRASERWSRAVQVAEVQNWSRASHWPNVKMSVWSKPNNTQNRSTIIPTCKAGELW